MLAAFLGKLCYLHKNAFSYKFFGHSFRKNLVGFLEYISV
jgi:hypothetical protein